MGFAIGMMRTVIPALAKTEFGLACGSLLLLTAFVVPFGLVKAVMNCVAGRLSERMGRQRVVRWGWIIALPVPVMIWVLLAFGEKTHPRPKEQRRARPDDPERSAVWQLRRCLRGFRLNRPSEVTRQALQPRPVPSPFPV